MRNRLPMYRIPSVFDDFFNDRFLPAFNTIQGQPYLASDVEENDTAYVLTIDLPGVSKERVSVEIDTKYVNISVKEETVNTNKKYLLHERVSGFAGRTYKFNEILDADNAKADYTNGVLVLTIPKKHVNTKKVLTFTE